MGLNSSCYIYYSTRLFYNYHNFLSTECILYLFQAEDNMIRKFFSPTIPPTALLSTTLPSRNQHQLTKQSKSVPKKQNSAVSHNVDEDVAQRALQKTIRNQVFTNLRVGMSLFLKSYNFISSYFTIVK